MNTSICIYNKDNQFNTEEIQQIYNLFYSLQQACQIKKYINNVKDCKTKYGNLGNEKEVWVLKVNRFIACILSLSQKSQISFIGTHYKYQHNGYAKQIIKSLKNNVNYLYARIDSLFPNGIESLLKSCDFKKKNVNIWEWKNEVIE